MIKGRGGESFRIKPFSGGEKELFKMIPLPAIRHINNIFCLPFLLAVGNGGQIGGGIITGPIRFAYDEGLLGKAFMLGMKHNQGTGILLADVVLANPS